MSANNSPHAPQSGFRATASSGPILLSLAAVLLVAGLGLGQPAVHRGHIDADGIALPDGAIARLGAARLRFGGTARTVVFSADGKLLACADSKGVIIFELATGRVLHNLQLAEGQIPLVVRFLADGKRVAVGSAGRGSTKVAFYTLTDGKLTGSSEFNQQQASYIIDVTPDGSRTLLVVNLVRAYMWDLKSGRELWSCKHPGGSAVLPLTPDGKWFAIAQHPQTEVRDAGTGKVVCKFPSPGPRFRDSRGTSVSPDGRLAATRDPQGGAVAVISAREPAQVRTLTAGLEFDRPAFSFDSRYLAGPGRFGSRVWDLSAADNAAAVAKLPAATTAGFSPDGKTLALAGDGFVALFSVGDWKALPRSANPPSPLYRVRVTDDGKRVLGHIQQGWLSWPAGGGPGVRLSGDGIEGIRVQLPLSRADVSADGKVAIELLQKPGKDGKIGTFALRVTDTTRGEGHSIPLNGKPQSQLYLSPNGRHVSISVSGPATRVWDAHTGEILFLRKGPAKERVLGVLPAADGRSLGRSVVGTWAGGSGDGPECSAVVVTDHSTGRAWKMDPLPWSFFDGIQFSRDGTRIVSRGRYDANLRKTCVSLWDARTGRRLAAWIGDYGLADPALSPDNRSLLVGDEAGRLTVVEIATGGERTHFQHQGRVLSAAFFPDGAKAVSSCPDGPVYVWDLIGKPGKWDPAKADAVWADLASADAKTGFSAIRKLRASPSEAVAFLKERVKTAPAPTNAQVAQWLRDLDAKQFAVRERAQRELTAAVDAVGPKLEAARKKATGEAGRRLDQILKDADGWTPDHLRQLRSCEVLEGIGTPDAVQVLSAWADSQKGVRLAIEAKESLSRLRH